MNPDLIFRWYGTLPPAGTPVISQTAGVTFMPDIIRHVSAREHHPDGSWKRRFNEDRGIQINVNPPAVDKNGNMEHIDAMDIMPRWLASLLYKEQAPAGWSWKRSGNLSWSLSNDAIGKWYWAFGPDATRVNHEPWMWAAPLVEELDRIARLDIHPDLSKRLAMVRVFRATMIQRIKEE